MRLPIPDHAHWTLACRLLLLCAFTSSPSSNSETRLFAAEGPEAIPGHEADDHAVTERQGMVLETSSGLQRVERPVVEPVSLATPTRFIWTGQLASRETSSAAKDAYQFAVQGVGRVEIRIDGKTLLDTQSESITWSVSKRFDLSGTHRIQVRLQSQPASHQDSPNHMSQLNVFWRGPGFRWEPLPADRLSVEPTANLPHPQAIYRGHELLRTLRCSVCHTVNGKTQAALPSPALTHLAQHTRRTWLLDFFAPDGNDTSSEDLPSADAALRSLHGRFRADEAQHLVAWMATLSKAEATSEAGSPNRREPSNGDPDRGRTTFLSVGCLACHQHGDLGKTAPFGGGNLSDLSAKRPAGFVEQWLRSPESINPHHRMPRFSLTPQDRADLEAFLLPVTAKRLNADEDNRGRTDSCDPEAGASLAAQHSCLACHGGPSGQRTSDLNPASDWQQSCLTSAASDRPRYRVHNLAIAKAIQNYVVVSDGPAPPSVGQLLLREHNCLNCHARGDQPGLGALSEDLLEQDLDLLDRLPTMRPPSLDSVGDKLHRHALQPILRGQSKPRRPWLAVQMPSFDLADDEVMQLIVHLVQTDRVPDAAYPQLDESPVNSSDRDAGERLVTSSGFGCTSCHAIGKSRPPAKTPVNQLAPNLSLPGQRMRSIWFQRWVRNPARIVPRMEMPSVQIPAPGICGGSLDRQLRAVWDALNQKGFSPPDADPTRFILLGRSSRPAVVTDVFQLNGRKLIKPFLVALPNGANVLLDLQRPRLAAWWQGMAAQQRTQGKTWFWDPGAKSIKELPDQPELALLGPQVVTPSRQGQFACELEGWKTSRDAVEVRYRLHFLVDPQQAPLPVRLMERIQAAPGGWQRVIQAHDVPDGFSVGLRRTSIPDQMTGNETEAGAAQEISDTFARLTDRGDQTHQITLNYHSDENYAPPQEPPTWPAPIAEKKTLKGMPGFQLTQLPVRTDLMPIALAWRSNGELIIGSLKGRVWRLQDSDSDGLPDTAAAISDDLAAPYGIYTAETYVDVANKHSLIRLHDDDEDGVTDRHEIIASGWGHTDDYHDWVVGLPRDEQGNYYLSIPCQQDDRPSAAAAYRGRVVQLKPDEAGKFAIQEISRGHRFPMGIARNRQGQIFVTDNQGNYNPFNELNHVLPGRHFGFINALEKRDPPPAKVTPTSIAIPHPWTRSVNGICFLETPDAAKAAGVSFGPLEGHLVGCEYDTRRLIRMSLDDVDGQIQGAAYPLADAPADPENGFQGPIQCAVSPTGELHIASIRDSGWGGGNNSGSIVRAQFRPSELPTGIAEVQAAKLGFRITFTRPIDRSLASRPSNYACSSYRRIATPAYGGDDVDRRTETIKAIQVASDGMSVTIELSELRTGFVYEWKLDNLAGEGQNFFPAEAYYSLNRARSPD